ncbi:MAG TPA: bifunctional aldolase/short-chain dehydrogenase [Chloroflexota bacterium]|nr:bifunctional aldolase/short-chain dehydrogenase [Chloroflexota bacterium]
MAANLWNDADAAGRCGLAALVYRSNLLGRDRTLVNVYGGNTSVKVQEQDHVGRAVDVLWVKGSGSDLATITAAGFAGLKLDEVLPLFAREAMSDEEMVAYLDRTMFEPGRPRQSIETLLHAFVPAPHVDHTHPDAIISLACAPDGERIMREIYGQRAAWVPYIRPGFTLAQQIGAAVRGYPALECVVMGKHGLVTWGATAQECYVNTLRIIGEAEAYITTRIGADRSDQLLVEPLPAEDRANLWARLLPVIRGGVSAERRAILRFDDASDVLHFVGSREGKALSQAGAACPDHLVHTKRLPLWLDWQPAEGEDRLLDRVRSSIAAYAADYKSYFEAHREPSDRPFPAAPRVILVPGLGMVTTGPDAQAADVTGQLYHRAIAVMRGARALGGFTTLSPAESFAVEYWPLELYKLSLKPAPKALHGRVALITGAASGIGRAIARRLAADGAHVVIADLNLAGAEQVADELLQHYGLGRGLAVACDVTSEEAVATAFTRTVLAHGGVDIVVNNAGIATSAPIEETSLALWERNQSVLATGYFLVAREAFRLCRAQGLGGSVIFIASKNAVAAGRNASAYSAAKAAELHLARCLAEEGGSAGIRVNSVLPDAVLSGSSIWDGQWRAERAATYGIAPEQLEEHYRARTTLRVNIFPEDIAEAVYFFATDNASKTTGGVLTVDGGVPTAYVR